MNTDPGPSKTLEFERIELETIAALWLALESASSSGDREARAFVSGTYGPWASETIKNRAS